MRILLINFSNTMLHTINGKIDEKKYKTFTSETLKDVKDEISRHRIQICLINVTDDPQALTSLVTEIKKSKNTKKPHILLLASDKQKQLVDNLLDAGADDFMYKPFSIDDLTMRFKLAGKILKLQNKIARSQKNVLKLAKEDPHTGLLNRRALLDRALSEMGRASREGSFISSLMLTMSNFKKVLDPYDSDSMDEMLEQFGARLKKSCRPYDMVGRFGISEFLIILPDTGKDNSVSVARRIIDVVTSEPLTVKGVQIECRLAIGIAELDPDKISKRKGMDDRLMNDIQLDSLIRDSETAMEAARKAGDNVIEVKT